MHKRTIFPVVIIALLVASFQSIAQNNEKIFGIFIDTLKVPGPGIELRLAITVSKSEDGEIKASFNSVDQGSGEIDFDEVKLDENHLLLSSKLGIQIEGDYITEKDEIKGEFRQGVGKFPMRFKRIEKLPDLLRPQEPKKPYPYIEEDVNYKNEDADVKLAATLTLPNGEGPFPAVILLSGSGPQNRNEELFGHKPFLVIADYLTRNGIAVLRADDRGVGESTGDFKSSTTGDFADDALTGVKYLKSREEINPDLVGIIGHSEGGMMAPIAATKSSNVKFIVLLAGPGSNLGDNVIYQRNRAAQKMNASPAFLEAQKSWLETLNSVIRKDLNDEEVIAEIKNKYAELDEDTRKLLGWTEGRLEGEAKAFLSHWWRYGLRYNPELTIGNVSCPVLALLGEKDQQVPVHLNQKVLKSALGKGHTKNELVIVEGVNHLFQNCETGDEMEYIKIDETISLKTLSIILNWIQTL